jgi:hypothetical protein
MKRGLCLTLMTFSLGLPLQARIGETLEQCVGRYGPVMEKRPATIAGSEPESSVFSKASITIIAEFRDGLVWQISFRKAGLSAGEAEAILQANGSGLWSVPLKVNGQEYRISSDKKKLLTMSVDKKGVIGEMVIMTRECAAEIKSGHAAKPIQPSSSPEKKPAGNPLPGF